MVLNNVGLARLIACRNPLLAEERGRKRNELLEATEKQVEHGSPAHSFPTLLKDLATLTRNEARVGSQTLRMLATPTPLQLSHNPYPVRCNLKNS
jgi:hypothetical protein